jgi:phosphoglucosamine mutase
LNRLFGTDGIRGVANTELTPELSFKLGKVGTYLLSKNKDKPLVLIGKDTRLSGALLENAISAGIMSMGGTVLKLGVVPTPAIAYLVKEMKADAGIMISASHNTYEYNGIKIFNSEGFKLDDDLEDEIEDIIVRDMDLNGHIEGKKIGSCLYAHDEARKLYEDFLKDSIADDLSGLKIAIDCANGASYEIAESVFKGLGASVSIVNNKPDGFNINANCGSTDPSGLVEKVLAEGADVGFAFDGDADRLISVDEKGRVVDGDRMIFICAKMLKEQGRLRGNRVTATVMSNLGLRNAVRGIGAVLDTTKVGDRYVLESMLKTDCVIGGEQSGHIIFLEHSTTGDGMLSALQLLSAIKTSGKRLSELSDQIVIYPQVLRNATIKNENKKKYISDEDISKEISRIEGLMEGEGRVLVRPSGTEPLIRVMLEGKDIQEITDLAEGLVNLIERKMG